MKYDTALNLILKIDTEKWRSHQIKKKSKLNSIDQRQSKSTEVRLDSTEFDQG